MRNKKAFEMTISTVILLVLGLVLLAIGIYLIYTRILTPGENAGSFISCESMKGQVASGPGCPNMDCISCPQLISGVTKKTEYCCIKAGS